MIPEVKPDFRLALVRQVEVAVGRASYYLGVPPELSRRASEALILRMLSRFPTEEALRAIQGLQPYLRISACRQLIREFQRDARSPLSVPLETLEGLAQAAPAAQEPFRQAAGRLDYAELMGKLQTGLRELTARERQILELRLKGFRYRTIAAILDATANTVQVQGSAGMKKLRRIYRASA